MPSAVSVDHVWKSFRLYHERNQYLKAAVLRGRRARYDEFFALKDVSFEVDRGSTFGIVGSNGSGKSTLLKCLAGILFPEKGSVTSRGRLSALLELGAGFHLELTGRENVYLNGAILGMGRREIQRRFDSIVDFAGLVEFIDTPVKNYSSGMTVRLGFAIAANVEPEILLIDEVLAVGDASFQRKCAEKIDEFRNDGRTIILVSHATGQVEQLCEEALWLERGEVRLIGPSFEVVNAYTGASHQAVVADGEDELGERWGSQEAQIVSVQLLDETGNEAKVFSTGEPMRLRVNLVAHTPIRDPVVSARIEQLHGPPLWSSSTRKRRHTIELIDGPATVDVEIRSLVLLEGIYSLTLSVTDHSEAHPYDHWERRIHFEVRQTNIYDAGIVFMPSSFKSSTRRIDV
jgi:ABC-type polysaccharide/polyol phosphate transport system ATPase subunit